MRGFLHFNWTSDDIAKKYKSWRDLSKHYNKELDIKQFHGIFENNDIITNRYTSCQRHD